ncbi:Uncharacterised protein [Mycobacteroides abscessus subsp. abscessus]|nr:Uncharacterised protein [Mycobacteroides abscessus subsp. abscessus]
MARRMRSASRLTTRSMRSRTAASSSVARSAETVSGSKRAANRSTSSPAMSG